MKITINLSEAEVNGIKQYLKEIDDTNKPTKKDVKIFIDSIIQAIHAPQEAVSHYIKQYQK